MSLHWGANACSGSCVLENNQRGHHKGSTYNTGWSGVDEGVPHDSAITSWESPARRDLLSASETGTATATNPPNFEQDADGEVDLEYMDDVTADERWVAATTPELSL